MTKEEAKSRLKESWREMQRKGLPSAFDVEALIDNIIDDAFEWTERENLRKPTLKECINLIKKHARDMGGEVNITILF